VTIRSHFYLENAHFNLENAYFSPFLTISPSKMPILTRKPSIFDHFEPFLA